MSATREPEVIEPEVLPPEKACPPGREEAPRNSTWRRVEQAFGPIAAGIVIDTIDIATFGQFGLMAGLLIGGSAAYWMTSLYNLSVLHRLMWALAAGVYCTFPRTEMIPLATMIGAFARYVQSKNA